MMRRRAWLVLSLGAAALGSVACVGPTPLSVTLASPAGASLTSGAEADAVVFQANLRGHTAYETNGGGFGSLSSIVYQPALTGGQIFVPDPMNNRVMVFAQGASTGADATTVLGEIDSFQNDGRNMGNAILVQPYLVATDDEGRIYVADFGSLVSRLSFYESLSPGHQTPDATLVLPLQYFVIAMRVLHLGPNGAEYLVVSSIDAITGTYVGLTLFPAGDTEPVAGLTVELPPCIVRDFAAVGSGAASTLLLACDDIVYRCPEVDQGGASPPTYTAPSYNCGAVFATRIAATGLTSRYVLPAPVDPTFGGDVPPAYAMSAQTVTSLALDVPDDALLLADAGNRVVRFTGVAAHLDALFNQPDPATTYPNGPQGIDQTVGPIYGQALPTDVSPNRGQPLPSSDSLSYAIGLNVDPNRDLWVADCDNNRVLRFTDAAAGTNLPTAILGQSDGATALPNRLESYSASSVDGMATSASDRLVIADGGDHRVLSFPDAKLLHTNRVPDETDVFGQSFPNAYLPNAFSGGAGPDSRDLRNPGPLAIDPGTGFIYIGDTGNFRIVIHSDANNAPDDFLGTPDLTSVGTKCFVFGAMAARNGALFVAAASRNSGVGLGCVALGDANRVLMYTLPNTKVGSENGVPDRIFGQASDTDLEHIDNAANRGAAAPRADSFDKVTGVAVDSTGRLWVVDSNNRRVLWFDDPKGADLAEATTADGVVGQIDFGHKDLWGGLPDPGPYGFSGPHSLAVDGAGGLWVSDPGASRVLYFPTPTVPDPDTGMPKASIVLGQSDMTGILPNHSAVGCETGVGPPCEVSGRGLSTPTFVALAGGDRMVLVADADNIRVLRFYVNRPPQVAGSGAHPVVAGTTGSVSLTATDPDGDTLDPLVLGLVTPASLATLVTLSGNQLTLDARTLGRGTRVTATLSVQDQAPRPATTSVSVVFDVIADPASGWTPGTVTPRTPVAPATGCACGGTRPELLGILALALPLMRRRRARETRG